MRDCPPGRVTLIEDGIARGVVWDSETAALEGRAGPLHRPRRRPLVVRRGQPAARPCGDARGARPRAEELVRQMQRGVWVTRFHYTHCPDPKRVIATGTTRDGTFLVENGEVVAAVREPALCHERARPAGQHRGAGPGQVLPGLVGGQRHGQHGLLSPGDPLWPRQFTGVTTF